MKQLSLLVLTALTAVMLTGTARGDQSLKDELVRIIDKQERKAYVAWLPYEFFDLRGRSDHVKENMRKFYDEYTFIMVLDGQQSPDEEKIDFFTEKEIREDIKLIYEEKEYSPLNDDKLPREAKMLKDDFGKTLTGKNNHLFFFEVSTPGITEEDEFFINLGGSYADEIEIHYETPLEGAAKTER